jgi:hypothetical protein
VIRQLKVDYLIENIKKNSFLLIIEQQTNKLWDSFKQSSKYSTTSLAGPILLEDPETKRLRWKNKIRDLWIQRYNVKPTINTVDMDTE